MRTWNANEHCNSIMRNACREVLQPHVHIAFSSIYYNSIHASIGTLHLAKWFNHFNAVEISQSFCTPTVREHACIHCVYGNYDYKLTFHFAHFCDFKQQSWKQRKKQLNVAKRQIFLSLSLDLSISFKNILTIGRDLVVSFLSHFRFIDFKLMLCVRAAHK